jgi:hypothetical protein
MFSARGASPESLLRQVALYLLAFAWPWGVYQTERLLFLPFSLLPVVLLIVLELRAALRGRRPWVPFEFTWPVAVLVGAAGVHAARTGTTGILAVVVLEAITVLVLLQAVRTRQILLRCLGLSVLAGALAALVSLLVDTRLLPGSLPAAILPAGYTPATGASLAFAHTVPNGVLTLVICFVPAGYFLLRREGGLWTRAGALAAAVVILAALGHVALEVFAWPRTLPHAPAKIDLAAASAMAWTAWRAQAGLGMEALTALAALLWLISRAWGKVFLSWRENGDGLHAAALVALLLAGLCLAWFPIAPHAGLAVLFGLFVRHAFPLREEKDAAPVWPCFTPVLLVPLLLANIVRVDPANPHDPRNYPVVMGQWHGDGRHDDANWLAQFVWSHSPAEERNAYAMARAALEATPSNLVLASYYVTRMAAHGPAGPRPVLPSPGERERDALLTLLRDKAAAVPPEEAGFAYERALVALGQPENALEALRYRIRPAAARTGNVRMMAGVVAHLLGAPELEAALRAWDAPMLYDVLSQYDPLLAKRTEEVDMLAVLSLTAQGASVQVWSTEGVWGTAVPAPPGTVERLLLRGHTLASLPARASAGPRRLPVTLELGAPPVAERLLRVTNGPGALSIEVEPEAWGLALCRPVLAALP